MRAVNAFLSRPIDLAGMVMLCGLALPAGAQPAAPNGVRPAVVVPAATPAPTDGVQGPRGAGPSASAPVRFLVVAAQESILAASVPGRLARVPVNLGDAVKAGQLLAAFDCAEAQARRDAGRAELEAARVQYEGKLKLQGLQSAAEIEVELAAANVNKAQSQIKVFDAQLAQCNFVAPFAGRVARVHVKVGQGINPGAPVVELVGNGPLKARMNVPSNWLAWLKAGDQLEGRIDETNSACTLKVVRISARVDAVSQTVEIEAELQGAGAEVLAGMSGQTRAPAGR